MRDQFRGRARAIRPLTPFWSEPRNTRNTRNERGTMSECSKGCRSRNSVGSRIPFYSQRTSCEMRHCHSPRSRYVLRDSRYDPGDMRLCGPDPVFGLGLNRGRPTIRWRLINSEALVHDRLVFWSFPMRSHFHQFRVELAENGHQVLLGRHDFVDVFVDHRHLV